MMATWLLGYPSTESASPTIKSLQHLGTGAFTALHIVGVTIARTIVFKAAKLSHRGREVEA
jgi:hypothetical protein